MQGVAERGDESVWIRRSIMEGKKRSVRVRAGKARGVLGEARLEKPLDLPSADILLASDANAPVSIGKSRRNSRKVVRGEKIVSCRHAKAPRQSGQMRVVAPRVGLPLDESRSRSLNVGLKSAKIAIGREEAPGSRGIANVLISQITISFGIALGDAPERQRRSSIVRPSPAILAERVVVAS